MTELLRLENGVVNLSEEAVLVPQLKVIKDQMEWKYIYMMTSIKSPYQNYHDEIREEKIKTDIAGDKDWQVPEEVKQAVSKIEEMQETSTLRMVRASRMACDQMATYLKNKTPEDKSWLVNVKSLPTLVSIVDEMEKQLKKEIQSESKYKSNYNPSKFEL